MLVSGIFTADSIDVTITGKNVPAVNPENVTDVSLPAGITSIDANNKGSVNSPIYIAADLIPVVGNSVIVPTVVAKSG
jgi:hypothetical protein